MKYAGLLIAILFLVSFSGCTSTSSSTFHTADEVTAIAKSFSPKCQKEIPAPPGKHG